MWKIVGPIMYFLKIKAFMQMSAADQNNMTNHVCTTMHHAIITLACWQIVFFACSEQDYFPVSDTEVEYFRYFYSNECRRMPNEMYGLAISFSIGYILWDSYRMLVHDKDWKMLDY